MSTMRYYETFYGIHVDYWGITFGGVFNNHHYMLEKEYVNDGVECTDTSGVTDAITFIYPHHIAKIYFIEGVIKGHFTLASSGATAEIEKYRVSLFKIHESTGDETELFTSGWVDTEVDLEWRDDIGDGIGEEMVFPFWIDAWEKEKITEFERLYLKIEVDANEYTYLWHSNDPTWEDVKVVIPLIV